jgi:hypothetical protein
MGISEPKSNGAWGSSKKLKNLPSSGSGFVDILKKNDIMPIPETHTAWVQKASCKLKTIILWLTYLVIDLHFHIVPGSIVGMLWRIMKLNVLRVPLDHLCGTVIARFSNDNTSEVSMSNKSEIDVLGNLRDGSRIGGNKCEGDCFVWHPPVEPWIFKIHWALLLPRIVAIQKLPVVSALSIVPIGIPIFRGLFLALD